MPSRPRCAGFGEPEAGLLSRELGILPGAWVDGLDLAETEPQLVGLASALSGEPTTSASVRSVTTSSDHSAAYATLPAATPHHRTGRASPLRLPEQAVLVGLSVHGHKGLGDLCQRGH